MRPQDTQACKTADDVEVGVIQKLYMQISWMQREGKKPVAIYLGHASLMELEKKSGSARWEENKPRTFFGLPIYTLVGHTHHVNVTSEVPDVE